VLLKMLNFCCVSLLIHLPGTALWLFMLSSSSISAYPRPTKGMLVAMTVI